MQTAEGDAGVYQNQSTQYTNSAPYAGGASFGGGGGCVVMACPPLYCVE